MPKTVGSLPGLPSVVPVPSGVSVVSGSVIVSGSPLPSSSGPVPASLSSSVVNGLPVIGSVIGSPELSTALPVACAVFSLNPSATSSASIG